MRRRKKMGKFVAVPVLLAALCHTAPAQISANSFRHHYITTDMPGENSWGFAPSALADFDKDGDLDYAVGNRGDRVYWFEYQEAGRWVASAIKFKESEIIDMSGIELRVMPKHDLIRYKRRLGRRVDRIDIDAMQSAEES